MTDIKEQMRKVIQSGIEGWIEAQFSGTIQPVDSLTDYPLQRDAVIVYYHSMYPYQSIEDAFLAQTSEAKWNTQLMQTWIEYHWQYAYLELAERFDVPVIELTEDMQTRRQQLRQEMIGQDYKQVKTR